MDVTVTGGQGKSSILLHYNANDAALAQARLLAASIDERFSSATYYDQNNPAKTAGATGGYLIATKYGIGQILIDARGYQAVTIQNSGLGATVLGGGSNAQSVLASNGGLEFFSLSGNTTVVAGGGANTIEFLGSGNNAAYTSNGNDSIVGGNGHTTISAGGGHNSITIGGGKTLDFVQGIDTIRLGAGAETIDVTGPGSALVKGAAAVTGPAGIVNGKHDFTLHFVGGGTASTVLGGAGSYSIAAGAGGGVFHGGTAGGNILDGGGGNVTLFGGGAGDELAGGTGKASLVAAAGNETLVAGQGDTTMRGASSGQDLFEFKGGGAVDTVKNFISGVDFLHISGLGAGAVTEALNSFKVVGNTGSFTLPDGTKVVLDGITHLGIHDFK